MTWSELTYSFRAVNVARLLFPQRARLEPADSGTTRETKVRAGSHITPQPSVAVDSWNERRTLPTHNLPIAATHIWQLLRLASACDPLPDLLHPKKALFVSPFLLNPFLLPVLLGSIVLCYWGFFSLLNLRFGLEPTRGETQGPNPRWGVAPTVGQADEG